MTWAARSISAAVVMRPVVSRRVPFAHSTGTAMAREANDFLYESIQKHPDRFIGFAALAPKNPKAAASDFAAPQFSWPAARHPVP